MAKPSANDIETAILRGLGRHRMNREIAEEVGLTVVEVRDRLAALCRRHGCRTKLELIGRAIALGFGPGAPVHRDDAILRVLRDNSRPDGTVPLSRHGVAALSGAVGVTGTGRALRSLERRGLVTLSPAPRSGARGGVRLTRSAAP